MLMPRYTPADVIRAATLITRYTSLLDASAFSLPLDVYACPLRHAAYALSRCFTFDAATLRFDAAATFYFIVIC